MVRYENQTEVTPVAAVGGVANAGAVVAVGVGVVVAGAVDGAVVSRVRYVVRTAAAGALD